MRREIRAARRVDVHARDVEARRQALLLHLVVIEDRVLADEDLGDGVGEVRRARCRRRFRRFAPGCGRRHDQAARMLTCRPGAGGVGRDEQHLHRLVERPRRRGCGRRRRLRRGRCSARRTHGRRNRQAGRDIAARPPCRPAVAVDRSRRANRRARLPAVLRTRDSSGEKRPLTTTMRCTAVAVQKRRRACFGADGGRRIGRPGTRRCDRRDVGEAPFLVADGRKSERGEPRRRPLAQILQPARAAVRPPATPTQG